ncbi:23S rRNA (cytidine(2498)-2'-O)-methyltransferase RlmM [Opacimonas viscosa]|uniref:23S rRNA (Cytidine(2498)-2'-O)-methyltransferase RlmM n=1 Tax=Opacimonas viscosa TaxID=2961944 RepID=A0AA41X193_9ALTE|nr:23S rRNA (cytidine(2498)-2'-O)-methyltransferase RlmM [Opacimonas viscosa]MCP3427641.1 23S rRNA (cytidine(2498)-2'-O)-methyltransferase RlmM [Opacimonas viscosa]
MKILGLLCYCRAGYEQNLAQELEHATAAQGIFGYASVKLNTGAVYFQFYTPDELAHCEQKVRFVDLMFARQLVFVFAHLPQLNRTDRLTDFAEVLQGDEFGTFTSAVVEHADTEDGKTLAKFCRKFAVPLRQMLRAKGVLQNKTVKAKNSQQNIVGKCMHTFFVEGDHAYLGVSVPSNRSRFENGIYRLKFPPDAPSRSTLKLEEAIRYFLSPDEQQTLLAEHTTAVDLGACPGGWTYQLVQRKMQVEAVDNGAMDERLMATGLVDYFAADGFKYTPQYGKVNWLVCDMIEQPDKVANLMTHWLVNGLCEHTIFNLKLPMKQRFTAMQEALTHIEAKLQEQQMHYRIAAKHLYHNRDEVTVCIVTESM